MLKRLTKKTIGCFEYTLKDHKPVMGEFGTYDAFFDYSMAIRQLGKLEDANIPRPVEEWHEDYGDCLFWKFPIEEPPHCGTPLDSNFTDGDILQHQKKRKISMRSQEVIELREKISIMTPKNGVTEEYCIKRINDALRDGYIDSDADSDGIIYIEIGRNEAESLFNDLFENATFYDYLDTHCEGADDTSCDIAPMWGLLCKIIGDDVYFNAQNIELYKAV